MTEWFEQWFGEAYLNLYRHRDDRDAAAAISLIGQHVPLTNATTLDLACGPGRHLERLRAAGARAVGFDLSVPLLSRARHRQAPPLAVVRGDMRLLPFRASSFDVVVNLFTSFGYFADDGQHARVLRCVADVLKTGGTFVLDYFNAPNLATTLVAHEEQQLGTQSVIIDRRISDDRRYVLKEMHLVHDGRHFRERVRLFSPEDLTNMLQEAGLQVFDQFGDYGGARLDKDSPRVILLARRT